jgi:hypothetical protein
MGKLFRRVYHAGLAANLQPYCDGAVFAMRGVAPHGQSVNAELKRQISKAWSGMAFLRTSARSSICLSMMLSENRLPLFRIML